MTSSKRRRRIARTRLRETTEDDVGYGRPPREHQFQPGQSGNPKGRPKGRKNEATILDELLRRKIPVREAGRVRKISVLEAILLRFTEDSLKGNTKSAAFLLNRYRGLVGEEAPVDELGPDDREILEAFTQKILADKAKKKPR